MCRSSEPNPSARAPWAAEHDIVLVYLLTFASWLNLIECQFQALRRSASNGSDYASHAEADAGAWPRMSQTQSSCSP